MPPPNSFELGIWLPWTPGWTGFSSNPTVAQARYLLLGSLCFIYYQENATGTSNSTAFTITGLPVSAATTNPTRIPCRITDNGATAVGAVGFSGTVATLAKDVGGAAFTASGSKGALFNAFFEVA